MGRGWQTQKRLDRKLKKKRRGRDVKRG